MYERCIYCNIITGPGEGGKGGEAAVSRAIRIFKAFAACAGKRGGIVLRATGILEAYIRYEKGEG